MMGEHGGRKKRAKKAKAAKGDSSGGWDGCGAPAVLIGMILVILIYVFRNELGNALLHLLQQLTGR